MMIEHNTRNWQVSIADTSQTVTDIDDVAQCVYLILSTVKGSDPLRPTFGSDVWRFLDSNMNEAQPMLVYEVYTALELWEKRLKVTGVRVRDWGVDRKNIEVKGDLPPTPSKGGGGDTEILINVNL